MLTPTELNLYLSLKILFGPQIEVQIQGHHYISLENDDIIISGFTLNLHKKYKYKAEYYQVKWNTFVKPKNAPGLLIGLKRLIICFTRSNNFKIIIWEIKHTLLPQPPPPWPPFNNIPDKNRRPLYIYIWFQKIKCTELWFFFKP